MAGVIVVVTEQDVVANAGRVKKGLLPEVAAHPAQLAARQRRQGRAAQQYFALVGLKETAGQRQQRGLAAAAGAAHHQFLAGGDVQVEAFEQRAAARQRHADSAEAHRAGACRDLCSGSRRLRARRRRGEHFADAFGGGQRAGPVVPVLGQGPQGVIELRRQQQDEQAGEQRQALGRPELDEAEQAQADVDGEGGDGDGAEELQHRGRQESHPQHAHGARAEVLGEGRDPARLALLGAEPAKRVQAAQPVEEQAAQPAQRLLLVAHHLLRAHADEDHEGGNQRRGNQQQRAGQPVGPEHRDQYGRRHHGDGRHLRQEARVVRVQAFHLFHQHGGQRAGTETAFQERARVEHAREQFAAQLLADFARGAGGERAAQAAEKRARREHRQQAEQREPQRGQVARIDDRGGDDPGQQRGLGEYADGLGNRQP